MNPFVVILRTAGRRNPRLLLYMSVATFAWRIVKRAANGPQRALVFEVKAGETYEIRGIPGRKRRR